MSSSVSQHSCPSRRLAAITFVIVGTLVALSVAGQTSSSAVASHSMKAGNLEAESGKGSAANGRANPLASRPDDRAVKGTPGNDLFMSTLV